MPEQPAEPDAIVTTEWVAEHLDDPAIVIAEVDSDLDADYRQGHVPGAVGWGLHTDMEDPVRRDIPGVAQLEALLGRSGIDNDTTVVVYGDGNNRSATWAFWVLKYYKHRDVRLMDGGRSKWLAEGRPISTDAPTPRAVSYRAQAPDRSIRATRQHILDTLSRMDVKLLDTRTAEEYSGALTSAPGTPQPEIYRKGRIPGAVHVPWDDGAGDDGAFRPVEELRQLYEERGLTPDDEVVPYCRLGVRASYSWFVLRYLLGYPRVRNYDGSWTEWGNSTGLPIETDAV